VALGCDWYGLPLEWTHNRTIYRVDDTPGRGLKGGILYVIRGIFGYKRGGKYCGFERKINAEYLTSASFCLYLWNGI
jgi:hypothetical protein